jgi:hypothetical protein
MTSSTTIFMTRLTSLAHEFVEYVPETVEAGKLYISIPFKVAVHLCCCGCGVEVATPISPADWELTFDGDTVSLGPSIENWGLRCKSHYWIEKDRVLWAAPSTKKQIASARLRDKRLLEQRFRPRRSAPGTGGSTARDIVANDSVWQKVKRLFRRQPRA